MQKKYLFAAAIAAVATLAGVVPAQAAPPGSGWDDNPDVVIGGGSDTTYLVSQRLEVLYNGTPGCAVDTGGTSVNKGKCNPAGQVTPTNGNFDHDVFVSATPTGSGAGVNALLPTGVQYNPAIDYARSSRGPQNSEANDLTFWGYARDAIAVITFGSRTVSLTKQDLIDIYTCAKTDWSQFGLAAGTIIPWDMNSASGTRSTFITTYLGNPTLGTCVRKLTTGIAPFENDVKPLLADKGPDGIAGTTDDDENNYLWWLSFGDWSKYPYTANGFLDGAGVTPISSNLVTVDGTVPSAATITNNSYAILRTLYQVTREQDADCNSVPGTDGVCNNGTNPTVYGTTTGKGGAVRGFTEFICRTSNAQQQINPVTGRGYRSEIVSALNAEGFQQVPTSLRTSGYACSVSN